MPLASIEVTKTCPTIHIGHLLTHDGKICQKIAKKQSSIEFDTIVPRMNVSIREHILKTRWKMSIMKKISSLLVVLAIVGMTSCGKQPDVPVIPGVKGPFFNVQNGAVLISMEFETLAINQGIRVPIPKLQNSSLELTPAQFSGGTFFQAVIDFDDIENGNFEFVNPESLPGGRPLPGIVGGTLPAVAVNVPDFLDTTFYLSKKVFGFFTPFRLNVQAIFTQRLYMNGKYMGNISLVGVDEQGDNSGILLLLNISSEVKKDLKKVIELSKKNPKSRF
ncbi:MAG: hypothetical protein JNM93_06765 [Bacteriovoracaceae bacterium]|nr:hypothetical protein [Bacteriovoracaceae bacterium]